MHLSNICLALTAMASMVYSSSEDCYSDQNDFEPGQLGGISKLPHEINSNAASNSAYGFSPGPTTPNNSTSSATTPPAPGTKPSLPASNPTAPPTPAPQFPHITLSTTPYVAAGQAPVWP
ncbi:hypothetical protein KCU83_g758, partial [Aureobasidium melanogenum]